MTKIEHFNKPTTGDRLPIANHWIYEFLIRITEFANSLRILIGKYWIYEFLIETPYIDEFLIGNKSARPTAGALCCRQPWPNLDHHDAGEMPLYTKVFWYKNKHEHTLKPQYIWSLDHYAWGRKTFIYKPVLIWTMLSESLWHSMGVSWPSNVKKRSKPVPLTSILQTNSSLNLYYLV